MTTFVDFLPTPTGPFQFQATLDGANYSVIVRWNIFGQRWYANVYALDGTLIVSIPLIGSPPKKKLVTVTYFPNSSTEVLTRQAVVVETELPLGYRIGSLVDITVADVIPSGYNGLFRCTIVGSNSFLYPLATNPGPVTNPGNVSKDISLVAGYFKSSTLVWRAMDNRFEVSP